MEQCLISVIIPVYNVEKYLTACVESVRNSDYENLEIILVDDGSPDNCPKMCDEFAKSDERIVVVHKENGGLSSARNAGIDIAKGEYITFVDSDDEITADMISYMYTIAVKENCDIVQMGICVVHEGEDIELNTTEEYIVITPEQAIHNIYEGCYVNATVKLYERGLFDDGMRFPHVLHEDAYITPRLFHKSRSVAVSEKHGYIYFQRQGSIMHRANDLARLSVLDILDDRVRLFQSWGYEELSKDALKDYFCYLLKWYGKLKETLHRKELREVKRKIKKCCAKDLILEHRLRCWAMRFGVFDIADKYLKGKGL